MSRRPRALRRSGEEPHDAEAKWERARRLRHQYYLAAYDYAQTVKRMQGSTGTEG